MYRGYYVYIYETNIPTCPTGTDGPTHHQNPTKCKGFAEARPLQPVPKHKSQF